MPRESLDRIMKSSGVTSWGAIFPHDICRVCKFHDSCRDLRTICAAIAVIEGLAEKAAFEQPGSVVDFIRNLQDCILPEASVIIPEPAR